jgi:hypothetical protein
METGCRRDPLMTAFSMTTQREPTSTGPPSDVRTAPNNTRDPSPTRTSPLRTAVGAIQAEEWIRGLALKLHQQDVSFRLGGSASADPDLRRNPL